MLWASLRENPAPPHDCILPSFLFPLSCFSSHLIHIPPTHVAHTLSFLKQHSDFVICLLGHIFLHWIGPDSSICGQTPTSTQPLQTDPPLLIPGHYVSLQWVSLVHETRLSSPISSVHALFPSETIFLHHSHFAITKVKLWDLELCLYPVFSVYLFNFHSVL